MAVGLAAVLAAGGLAGGVWLSGRGGEPVPPVAAPTAPANIEELGGLVPVGEAKDMPGAELSAVEEFGQEKAASGAVWALSYAQMTAYDMGLWAKMLNPSLGPVVPEDYLRYAELMTEAGTLEWARRSAAAVRDDPERGVGGFLLVPPKPTADVEWASPAMRPAGVTDEDGKLIPADSFDVRRITAGDPADGGLPTLRVEFSDYHVFDFEQDSVWRAVEVGRSWVMDLVETGDPKSPWLLERWTVGKPESKRFAPQVREYRL